VTVQIDDHPSEARPYVLNDIASRWRVDRAMIETVLASWTAEQLQAHLQTFTSDELRAPSMRR
jgi:hypothetical protein